MCLRNTLSLLKVPKRSRSHTGVMKNSQATVNWSTEPFRFRAACEEGLASNFDVRMRNMYGSVYSLNKYVKINSYDSSSIILCTGNISKCSEKMPIIHRAHSLAYRQQTNIQTRKAGSSELLGWTSQSRGHRAWRKSCFILHDQGSFSKKMMIKLRLNDGIESSQKRCEGLLFRKKKCSWYKSPQLDIIRNRWRGVQLQYNKQREERSETQAGGRFILCNAS